MSSLSIQDSASAQTTAAISRSCPNMSSPGVHIQPDPIRNNFDSAQHPCPAAYTQATSGSREYRGFDTGSQCGNVSLPHNSCEISHAVLARSSPGFAHNESTLCSSSPLAPESDCVPTSSTPPSESITLATTSRDSNPPSTRSCLHVTVSQLSPSSSGIQSNSTESDELDTENSNSTPDIYMADDVDVFAAGLVTRLAELRDPTISKILSPLSSSFTMEPTHLTTGISSSPPAYVATSHQASRALRYQSSHTVLLPATRKRSLSSSDLVAACSSEPCRKRISLDPSVRKISYPPIEHAQNSLSNFGNAALEPASLRKSLSLISEAEEYRSSSPLVSDTRPSRSQSHASTNTDSQTESSPTSPTPSSKTSSWTKILDLSGTEQPRDAPPYLIFVAALKRTPDDIAMERLQVMRDSEHRMREGDTALKRAKVAVAMLEMTTPQPQEDQIPTVSLEEKDSINHWNTQYAVPDKIRRDCVKWILDVVPPDHRLELHDALKSSHSTRIRFHAAFLLNQYFLYLGAPNSPETSEKSTYRKGVQDASLDMAITCLALSIKFNRDVLLPLHPLYIDDFLELAQGNMRAQDLEALHRDLLLVFGYNLGRPSPEAYMSELWAASASLRALLSFDDGWKTVQASVWEVLFDAIEEPDCMQFPVYTLTATALSIGIVDSLVSKYTRESIRRCISRRAEGQCLCASLAEAEEVSAARRRRLRAARAAKSAMEDILDMLSISQVELTECRRWLDSLYC